MSVACQTQPNLDAAVGTGAVLRDLLDLLLGWSLEPGLQAKDRWAEESVGLSTFLAVQCSVQRHRV